MWGLNFASSASLSHSDSEWKPHPSSDTVQQRSYRPEKTAELGLVSKTFSACGGAFITALVVNPLDVIRVRLQVDGFVRESSSGSTRLGGSYDVLRAVIRENGIKGLWRGLSPTLAMAIPATGFYYTFYDSLKYKLGRNGATPLSALYAGAIARFATVVVTCPFEYIRTNLQAQSGATVGAMGVIRSAYKRGGFRVLWTGLVPTLSRDIPFSALYWFGYETVAHKLSLKKSAATPFIAGAVSGTVAAAVTTPIDVLKTIIQADSSDGGRRSVWKYASEIWKQEGAAGFFRGIAPRMARVAPSCAITIGFYEVFKTLFVQRNEKVLEE